MFNNTKKLKYLTYLLLSTILILSTLIYLKFEKIKELNNNINTLKEENQIKDNDIKNLVDENSKLESVLNEEQRKIVFYEDKITEYSDEVVELKKLTTIDKELLQKYSKVYFLNEHYEPDDLFEIDKEYLYNKEKDHKVLYPVKQNLELMLKRAKEDGVDIKVASAYRSFETQQNLKSTYVITYGAGTANQFSADQGYSEHQLGTTVDFTTDALNGSLGGFQNTKEYAWLIKNAHKYGFVLSYPDNNPYYEYEPWHFRFVGKSLAQYLYREKKNFYDLEQKKIDEYLLNIFD